MGIVPQFPGSDNIFLFPPPINQLNGEIKVRTGGYVGNGTGMRTIQSDITVYDGFVNWGGAIWGIFGGNKSFSVPAEANVNGTQYYYVLFERPS